MIRVTTFLHKDRKEEADPSSDIPDSWRVHSCTIDFGPDAEPLTISCDWVYASPIAAQHDMQQRAWEHIRQRGYAGSGKDIIWRVHTIE